MPDLHEPVHPAVERALNLYLSAAALTAGAPETGHPRIAERMLRQAARDRNDGERELAQLAGGGDG